MQCSVHAREPTEESAVQMNLLLSAHPLFVWNDFLDIYVAGWATFLAFNYIGGGHQEL